MSASLPDLIAEEQILDQVSPSQLDDLLAAGWRHFGSYFFRYNYSIHQNQLARVEPLRIPVAQFEPRQSQQRVRRKNRDLEVRIQAPQIDEIRTDLFERHKLRFRENIPESLASFLGDHPEKGPTHCLEFGVYNSAGRLLAASWLDVGAESVSSIYALFDPEEARRSLGLFTMLEELRYAREKGKRWYYSGYSYDIPSPYDYKKRFAPLERFNWEGRWLSASTE